MRDIVFRGKLLAGTSAGEWAYGNLDVKPGGKIAIITPDDTPIGKYGRVDPDTVGRFTGLTDKNGVRIFEGDVIQYGHGRFEIVWSENEARFLAERPFEAEEMAFVSRGVILGNVHDKPELIGGGGAP